MHILCPWNQNPITRNWLGYFHPAGRLLCDTYLCARELVREVDYTLGTLSKSLLRQERHDLPAADVPGD